MAKFKVSKGSGSIMRQTRIVANIETLRANIDSSLPHQEIKSTRSLKNLMPDLKLGEIVNLARSLI